MAKRSKPSKGERTREKKIPSKKTTQDKSNLQRGEGQYEPQDGNDIKWWAGNAQLLKDAASIPFSEILGLSTDWGCVGNSKGAFPGVCGLQYRPVPGDQAEPDSPINVCARNLMAMIRDKVSGQRKYDSPNVMMYLLAIANLYGTYAHLARMYGLIREYNPKNRYYPKAFFDIIGWDYDDFTKNQADFRLWINTLAEKIGSLCFPGQLWFTERAMWLNSRIFLDGLGSKAQTYFFYPEGMLKYMYNPSNAEEPISLDLVPLGPDSTQSVTSSTNLYWTFEDVRNAVDVVVQSLVEKEDIATMSGDFLKTFGVGGLWHLPPITEDYHTVPEVNEYALYQIHNSIMVPKTFLKSTDTANQNRLIYEYADTANARTWLKTRCEGVAENTAANAPVVSPYASFAKWIGTLVSASAAPKVGSVLLNMYKETPTEEDVMEMTRLTPALLVDIKSGNKKLGIKVRCATEVITGMAVAVPAFYANQGPGANVFQILPTMPEAAADSIGVYRMKLWRNPSGTGTIVKSFAPSVNNLNAMFDWFPHMFSVQSTSSSLQNDAAITEINAQLENYTFVSETLMRNMHYVAQLSVYSIPGAPSIT